MLEEIKKEFIEKHRFLVKKIKGRFGTVHYQLGHIVGDYYNQNNQNKIFDSEEEALNSIWQFIEQNLTEAIKQAKIEENGISSCMHCYAYEMTKEEHLQNFCSRWCVRMDKLYGWDVETDGCHKFEKSLRINELKGDK